MKTYAILLVVLILSLMFMAGCAGKGPYLKKTAVSTQAGKAADISGEVPLSIIKIISEGGEVGIADDTPASKCWIPKSQNLTVSTIAVWLSGAKLYSGTVPSSFQTSSNAVFNANIGPSALYINTYDSHRITLQPVWYTEPDGTGYKTNYLSGVVELIYDSQKYYVESNKIYEWLKNDKWKSEFEMQQLK